MEKHYVFVYGTLKRGEPNHSWICDNTKGTAEFKGVGRTVMKYPLVIGTKYNIPFLLQCSGKGYNVIGEVYEVNESMLQHLDILEDHPNFYVREIDEVQVQNLNETNISENVPKESNSSTLNCWIYFLKQYKPQMLETKFFEEYKSEGPHGLRYAERYTRDKHYNLRNEVM